jgi:hypothetical protein
MEGSWIDILSDTCRGNFLSRPYGCQRARLAGQFTKSQRDSFLEASKESVARLKTPGGVNTI